MGLDKEELEEMCMNGEFVELPLCPFCGELTDLRGDFTPCCCEETQEIKSGMIEWVRLIPIEVGYYPPDEE